MKQRTEDCPTSELGIPLPKQRVAIPRWYVTVPLGLYAVSFVLPLGQSNEGVPILGIVIFFWSMIVWPFGWLANVAFGFALWRLSRGHWYSARIISGIGLIPALSCIQIAIGLMSSVLHISYWVWLGAQVLVLALTIPVHGLVRKAAQEQPSLIQEPITHTADRLHDFRPIA